jgi:hypothetical protein
MTGRDILTSELGPWGYGLFGATAAFIVATVLVQVLEMTATKQEDRPTPLSAAVLILLTLAACVLIAIAFFPGGA